MDNKQQNLNYLKEALPHLTVSIIEPVLNSMQGDVDKALDELFNLNIGNESLESQPSNELPVYDLQKAIEEERLYFQQLEQAKQKKEEEIRRLEQLKREEEERLAREKEMQEKIIEREIARKMEEERKRLEEEKAKADREQLLQFKEILKREEEKKRNEEIELERARQMKEIEEQKLKLEEEKRLFEDEKRKAEELRKIFEDQVAEQQRLALIEQERKRKEEEERNAQLQKEEEERLRKAEEEEEEEERIKQEEERIRKEEEDRIQREREAEVENRVNNLMSKLDNNNLTKEQIEEKKLLFKSTLSKVDPVVYIYFRQAQQNIENSDEQATTLKQLFTALGVNPLAILVSDISSDYELASFLKSCYRDENIVYPFVSIHGKPVGNYHKILELNKNGTLRQYIDTPDSIVDLTREGASFVGQNVFDHCLDAAEYVISGVSTILWLPITILTWPFSGGKSQLAKQPMDVDIPVVHTNWYWRGLKRIFRFSNDRIIRIHPSHMDVRASHLYSSIDAIYIIASNEMKIQYDSQGADYLTAEASDIQLMKEIIIRKNPRVLVFDE